MKALLTGMSSYQGLPTAQSYIVVSYLDRLEDGEGDASVAQYFGLFHPPSITWRDAHNIDLPLLLPITLGHTTRIEVTEVFRYADRPEVRTTFGGWATGTSLDGTELDYTQLRGLPSTPGLEPLTQQAARGLVGLLPEFRQVLADTEQLQLSLLPFSEGLAYILGLGELTGLLSQLAIVGNLQLDREGWTVDVTGAARVLRVRLYDSPMELVENSDGSVTIHGDPLVFGVDANPDGSQTLYRRTA